MTDRFSTPRSRTRRSLAWRSLLGAGLCLAASAVSHAAPGALVLEASAQKARQPLAITLATQGLAELSSRAEDQPSQLKAREAQAESLPPKVEAHNSTMLGIPELWLDGQDRLQLRGQAGETLGLLFGAPRASGELDHRRVHPEGILAVSLDGQGRAKLELEGRLRSPARQVVVQAWRRGQGQQAGNFSLPLTFGPQGTHSASIARPGDLVVTEFMKDPTEVTDGNGEWIELRSNKLWRLDIEGITISDSSGASFTLNNGGLGILLAPAQRYVLGVNQDLATNGGVPVDYEWSGFSLKNSSDEIFVHSSIGHPVDRVWYDDGLRWPDAPGMSISLTDPIADALANNDPSLWCSASTVMGAGTDTGTPGAVNDVCP